MNKTIVFGKKTENKNEIIFVNMNDFFNPPRDYESEMRAINHINKIENAIINGKIIPELFSYKGISLWWCIKTNVRVSCGIFINFIINFSKFVDDECPKEIIVEDFQNLGIIKEICFIKKIKVTYSQKDYINFKKLEKTIDKNNNKRLNEKISELINRRSRFINKKYPKIANKTLFVTGSVFRRIIIDLKKNQTVEGEFIIQNIMNILENKKNIISMDYPSRFAHIEESITTLENRMKSDMEWFPIENLFLANDNKEHHNFLKKYQEIFNSDILKVLFQFDEISYFTQMNKRNKFLDAVILYWLKVIDGVYDFFIINKPKSVFLLAEIAPIPSMIIAICKQLKIKTIGMQHGIIYDYEASYSNIFGNENPCWIPIPEKMLLFGEIEKQILIQKGYPSKNLVVFGNPLFFKLDKINGYLQNRKLGKIYNINTQKKVILFFSSGYHNKYQPVGKYEYDLIIWKYLLEKFSKRKDFVVILKLHHWEESESFEEILRDNGIKNCKILKDNVMEMIYLSSVVVSTISTTIIDSLCFDKPVIQVIFNETKFKNPFDGYEAVITSKLNELEEKILEILNNKDMCDKIVKNGKVFLKKYYNIPEDDTKSLLQEILD